MYAIFTDFDRTISTRDMFDALIEGLGNAVSKPVAQDRTVREERVEQASAVRCSMDDAYAVLAANLELDETFPSFARMCRFSGLSLTILSTGIAEIETRLCGRLGIDWIPVIANDVEISDGRWRMLFRDDSPVGLAKEEYILAAARSGLQTVMIGDGRSDFEAARVANMRFAKSGSALEAYLREAGLTFSSFGRFSDLLHENLLGSPATPTLMT